MKENKQPEEFKNYRFKIAKFYFLGAALVLSALMITACANAYPPAPVEEPTATASPTETPLPVPTLTLTPTEDPFEGLKVCQTWREAANCPIASDDFARLPDFVKANYKFPPEAMRVSYIGAVIMPDHTSFLLIHALSKEEIYTGTAGVTESKKVKDKPFVYNGPLSPVGEPFFFNLKKNPPEINYDNLIAVFPVNNADGSLGTYSIIEPPRLWQGNWKTGEEHTKVLHEFKFDKMPYLPPVFNIGRISEGHIFFRSSDSKGSLITDIVEDTKNQKDGKRKVMFDEWIRTGILPRGLEWMPVLGSNFFDLTDFTEGY
jgi:hypothetical protein